MRTRQGHASTPVWPTVPRRTRAVISCWVVSSTILSGCGGDEALSPVSLGAGGSHTEVPTAVPTNPVPAPKRTILQRNPFGNVAETENLLFDGDFEWSSPFSDQYGWFQGTSATVADVVVGPDCRSGIKCVRLTKSQTMVGIGVASRKSGLELSVWVRFDDPTTACSLARVTLIDSLFGQIPLDVSDVDVHLVASDEPDQSGWCKLSGVSPIRRNKAYLSIRNTSTVSMLVDDAVMKKTSKPPSGILPPPMPPPPSWVPTADEAASIEETRANVRQLSQLRDGPPTPARRAFEKIHPGGPL